MNSKITRMDFVVVVFPSAYELNLSRAEKNNSGTIDMLANHESLP